MSAGFSDAQTTTTTSTTNTDKRLTTTSGEILALQDSKLTLGGNSTVNITSANADVALGAINAVSGSARQFATSIGEAAQNLAAGSNKIAADVAASQETFVATASGQKFMVFALLGVAGVFFLPQFFKGSK